MRSFVIRRKGFFLVALTFAALVVGDRAWSNVVYAFTESVPVRVLWKTPNQPAQKGDYALAPAAHLYIPENMTFLTKRVLCVAGDELRFDGRNWYCNGVLLNSVKPATKTGLPLEPFQWSGGVIPEGSVFLGSSHPDGFDSRYLGLFKTNEVVRLREVL